MAALALMTVASHFIGGAAGRWFERQSSVDAAVRPVSEGSPHDSRLKTVETQLKKMEAQLKRWRTRIDELSARAEKAAPRTSFADRQSIDDLKAKCALTQVKLDKLKLARP